jgi:sulfite reductase beta subunit-like hemoprotein
MEDIAMAGDNERFAACSQRWVRVAVSIASPETTDEFSDKLIIDAIYKTFTGSKKELQKRKYYEQALQALSEGNADKLGHLMHETKGNQLVGIMRDACNLPEKLQIAVQKIIRENIERVFRDITAQARVEPERYMRTKERLDRARDNIPVIAEKLTAQLLENPHGRWSKPKFHKRADLLMSLLR